MTGYNSPLGVGDRDGTFNFDSLNADRDAECRSHERGEGADMLRSRFFFVAEASRRRVPPAEAVSGIDAEGPIDGARR